MVVYVVEMCRWEDRENHSYTIGVWSKLSEALSAGISHGRGRGGKYGPHVIAYSIDNKDVADVMCRNEERAISLYKEVTGQDWEESEE